MLERLFDEEPTPEQTIKTYRVAGDMFLAGKELALERLNVYPYIPTQKELAKHVTREVPQFQSLTEWQRSLLASGLISSYALMEKRSAYQTRYMLSPDQIKYNLVEKIRRETEGEIDLDTEHVDFRWNLFSMALLAEESEFNKAKIYHSRTKKGELHGFVGNFMTELGLMPIVLKHQHYRQSLWHEDIHVWQDALGYSFPNPSSARESMQNPVVQRAALDENIRDGDYDETLLYFTDVLRRARRQMRLELPAYLWTKKMPVVDMLDNPNYGELNFAYVGIINTIHAQASNFNEKQQLMKQFEASVAIREADLESRTLMAIAIEGMKKYKGGKSRWDWVAGQTTVLPPEAGTSIYQAVILGRHEGLETELEIDYDIPLASTLITRARRLVHPNPYAEGGEIPKELVPTFWDTTCDVFHNRTLYADILDNYSIDLIKVKRALVKFARISVPQGYRGKTERELKNRLII